MPEDDGNMPPPGIGKGFPVRLRPMMGVHDEPLDACPDEMVHGIGDDGPSVQRKKRFGQVFRQRPQPRSQSRAEDECRFEPFSLPWSFETFDGYPSVHPLYPRSREIVFQYLRCREPFVAMTAAPIAQADAMAPSGPVENEPFRGAARRTHRGNDKGAAVRMACREPSAYLQFLAYDDASFPLS